MTTAIHPGVVAAVAVGGGVGALARHGATALWPGASPWTTLAVNAVGCAAIGVLMAMTDERSHRLARPFLGAGVLGGFTTFSAYAWDVHGLAADGDLPLAALYLAATPILALAAVWATTSATRRIRGRR